MSLYRLKKAKHYFAGVANCVDVGDFVIYGTVLRRNMEVDRSASKARLTENKAELIRIIHTSIIPQPSAKGTAAASTKKTNTTRRTAVTPPQSLSHSSICGPAAHKQRKRKKDDRAGVFGREPALDPLQQRRDQLLPVRALAAHTPLRQCVLQAHHGVCASWWCFYFSLCGLILTRVYLSCAHIIYADRSFVQSLWVDVASSCFPEAKLVITYVHKSRRASAFERVIIRARVAHAIDCFVVIMCAACGCNNKTTQQKQGRSADGQGAACNHHCEPPGGCGLVVHLAR